MKNENLDCYNVANYLYDEDDFISIKRVYDKHNHLSVVQLLNEKGIMKKCFFYDEYQKISNICIYNTNNGKEVKSVTYRKGGEYISSIREYDTESGKLLSVTFFKEDGKTISSIIEYGVFDTDIQFSLYCDDGEVISASI